MALPEKLYALRKRSGLSQEQLAEKLNVSRQAISKWETGVSYPETDKLIAVSRYFNVSLDYLINEDGVEAMPGTERGRAERGVSRARVCAGLIILLCGVVCLAVWGLLSLLDPAASRSLADSSAVAIDGNGVCLLLCAAAVSVGAALILSGSGKNRKE